MPKKTYTLNEEPSQRLEIHWRGGLYYPEDGIRVLVGGNFIGSAATGAELERGREFVLPDASTISVELKQGDFRVWRNGYDLAEIEKARRELRFSWLVMSMLGILNLAAMVMMLGGMLEFQNQAVHMLLAGVSGVLLSGSAWAARRKSEGAFVLAAVVYAFEMAAVQTLQGELDVWASMTIIWFVPWCIDGRRAIRKIAEQQTAEKVRR